MSRSVVKRLIHGIRSVLGTSGVAAGVAATQTRLDAVATSLERIEALARVGTPDESSSRLLDLVKGISARLSVLEETSEVMDQELADRIATVVLTTRETAATISKMAGGEPTRRDSAALDIEVLLGEARGALLRTMPSGAHRLLSVGCRGQSYFDWIEQTYGHVTEHIAAGDPRFKPATLPGNVTWIDNKAGDMSGVGAASCDLVFSDQHVDHLWATEVAGFLLESARVVRSGGHLVVDGHNRLITAPLTWTHPEHTIEFTVAEIAEMMRLAGFDITATYGVWLCRDPRTGALLPYDPNAAVPGWSFIERMLLARDRWDDSLIWWVEGVRAERAPKADAVHAMAADLFQAHWPERTQRCRALYQDAPPLGGAQVARSSH